MLGNIETLKSHLHPLLGLKNISEACRQLTAVVDINQYFDVAYRLRDDPALSFEQLIDLSGIDYATYREASDGSTQASPGPRFAVVLHLLSLTHNWRLRLKVFAPDDEAPRFPSVVSIWNSANWYEREAFDLFGIIFEGHPDLRRLLTDYGFIGYPFRKDFPISGEVEMRYDPEKKRVVYQPVTIAPREITPRVIREDRHR